MTPFLWLLDKESRELIVSKAWWVLLLLMGPLVGLSFISSVRTYAEVSAGVGEALSPLIGIWAPTFSACELAAVFLLPFVAIHLVAGDRESGALKLELQQGMNSFTRIAAKALVLLAGWLVAMLPPLSAIVLWKIYGGAVYPPELITLIVGHILNAGLTIALAAALASLTEHHSTAAILTLGATVGTWVLSFVASVQGGWWERAAQYTPAALVAEFQHGLIQLDVILIAIVLILTGLGLAAVWMRLGIHVGRRMYESAGLAALAIGAIFACTFLTANWDTSESRGNSFPEPDQRALQQIHGPLIIEVHLAPEDPRRVDLETRALSKLRRIIPKKLTVRYVAATSIGLFEQTSSGYGEIWYDVAGRRIMSRATTAEGVLEAIYSVAGVAPPVETEESVFRGHPLAVSPKGAGAVFYALWPCLFLASAILIRRRLQ
ncbi:MAG: ABC transporter permease subunit [Bryobacteraceae bacterium]